MRFLALWLKEEKALFSSPIAYVVVAVFLALMGYIFSVRLFVQQNATLVHLFFQMFSLFLLIVPIITMRMVAEERRQRTLEVLLTSPISDLQVVLAKYLAGLSLIVLIVLLSGSYAVVLAFVGEPDWGPIYSGYIGLVLLGSATVSLGLAASCLTANQVVAAALSLGLFLLLWIIDDVSYLLPAPIDNLATGLSLSAHFVPFATGSLYLSDLGYFLSLTLVGLFLGVLALGRR